MFKGLIQNEFIKLFSKKKTYIILGLFIILMIGFFFIAESDEKWFLETNSHEYQRESLEREIEWAESDIKYIKEDPDLTESEKKAEIKMQEERIIDLKNQIKFSNEEYLKTKDLTNKEKIALEIKELKKMEADAEDAESKSYFNGEINRLNIYLENDIPMDTLRMNNSISYLILSFTAIGVGFLAFGLILFNSDIVTGEYNPGTLKFLLIQPVTRIKVLLSKFLVAVVSSISLIIGVQILAAIVVGFIKGFGSLSIPVLANQKFEFIFEDGIRQISSISGSGYFITMTSFLLKSFVLQALFITAMISFIFLVSVIFQSTVVSMTVLIATLLGSNIIHSLSGTYRKISPFIFLHLTNAESIISGNIIQETEFMGAGFTSSVIVLVSTTILLLTASLYIFKKRDILI